MIQKTIKISNKLGLHARPAVMLVKTTGAFSSDIKIQKDDIEVDGKSIMGILMLAAGFGTELTISCDGSDEEEALSKVVEIFENGFGEK